MAAVDHGGDPQYGAAWGLDHRQRFMWAFKIVDSEPKPLDPESFRVPDTSHLRAVCSGLELNPDWPSVNNPLE